MSIPKIASYPMPDQAAMPTNRVGWKPEAKRAVLLIHDMQQYFMDFFDTEAAPVPALLANVRRLRAACDVVGVPVVYTAQPARQTAGQRGLLQDWWGPGITAVPERVSVIGTLAPRPRDVVLDKWRYSAFAKSDLLQRMRDQGRDQLIVCGVYAHIGCMMTVAEAFMNDIQAFMVGDAVADFSADQHALALSYVAGRCGIAITSEQVIETLRGAMLLPRSLEELRTVVATLLQIPADDLKPDDNLLDSGMDSIRLMRLIERWHQAGCRLGFAELAAHPDLNHWWALMAARRESRA
ncbi:isochorismatase family protein [Herbaspirillum autotrophicum]|uniref:isochorismatase family protein n=1 Tax=Herbaspirillum autotrophicum TaxID=180195 RepID=UPI000AE66461|nr:isochorismatase family protein [Herbaspirillum autotrophicum]